ncbi:MAG: SDR family oxidoreductase [Campylobacter sputorum]|uniref:SDR family NAD(P)-dependent oxidoreductase n=1 Tax=Campylobacter sputorum TaxID=206 RepID=UPI000B77930D|nr:SDR family oxidoreductase [Campylobacter sputorum]ASM39121.1 short-chain dehydrogenase/reductase [Campylobacter sputorum bv. paraureolyticus LMG 11764]MDY6120493.1 SDR family oxidoreductase [Campylobacter sputorum]
MKVMVISGTSRGIGKYLSQYYLERNFIVCGCARANSSITHKNYRHFELDISDEKAVISMIKNIQKEFKHIDILLNNAGIASMNPILLTPLKSVENIFNVNFKGTFLLLREVAKVMSLTSKKMQNPHFRIVNFATVATPLRLQGESIYAASKAAIVNFSQIASYELAPFSITINCIAPTPIKTDLIKSVDEKKMNSLINRQAIKRYGEFSDVSNAIDFFINEKSDFITGQCLYLGGING